MSSTATQELSAKAMKKLEKKNDTKRGVYLKASKIRSLYPPKGQDLGILRCGKEERGGGINSPKKQREKPLA